MPLITGKRACTKAGISANISAEVKAGRPQDQAVAIAFDVCRRARKKAKSKKKKH